MSDLPEGWVSTSISMLIDLNPKNDIADDALAGFMPMSFLGKDFLDIPKFEPRQWGEIKKSYTHFADGDVLLAKITPCFENGKAGIPSGLPNGVGAGSSEYFVCRTRSQVILPKYLLAYFKTPDFLQLGESQMTGSVGHKRVPKNYLLDKQIPLAPLNEQKRIADKLDRLLAKVDACRERCDRIPLILKRFRQSVLTDATSGELTEDWREAQSGECLRVVTLRDVATSFSYGSSAKSSPVGDIPVLRMGNIQQGKLDWNDLVFTSNVEEIEKYWLASGDVLFNRTNSPELVGKTAIYKGERSAIYAGYLIRVRCGTSLLPDYLNYCLNSPAGRDYCWQVKSDGVSQSNINAKKLAAFQFDLPTVEEQQEIVRRVELLFAYADRLETRYQTARKKCDQLTPALLEKAFQGELVPQDPNDEPASVLLERIKSLRTNAEAKQTKPQRRKTDPSR